MTVSLEGSDPRIKPGITANMKTVIAHVTKVVTVPLTAVFTDEQKPFVHFKAHAAVAGQDPASAFERRPVEVGICDNKDVEIKTGLAAGNEVALERPAPVAKKVKGPNDPDEKTETD